MADQNSFANPEMRRQLAIFLFLVGVHARCLPIAYCAVNDPSVAKTKAEFGNPARSPHRADYIRFDYTVENGLPDNVVNAILETENGFLWIGTQSGLVRFDGREFSPANLQASGSPGQGAVHSLLESSVGELWVGTDSGVVRIPNSDLDQFNSALTTFYHLSSAPSDQVNALLQARNGTIWAGTNHGLYREDFGKFVEVISGESISRIAETLDGHLLLINEGKIIEWNGDKSVRRPDLAASVGVPESDVFDIFEDHDGTMWYSTHEGLLRRGRAPLPQLRHPSESKPFVFRRPYADLEGNLWIGYGGGVYRITGNVMEDTAVHDVQPRCFYADHDGGIWVGTNGSGLIHLKRRIVRMFTTADGLVSNIPMAILSARDGKLWIGCNCGLSVYDGKRFTSYREKDGLLNTCVWSLAEDQNRDIWIGTYGGGLFRFRNGRFAQYSLAQGLISKIVLQVLVARDGSLWIATPDGVSHLQNGHLRNYTTTDGLSSNQVLAIHQDHSGTVWVATQDSIDRLVGERFVPFPPSRARGSPFSVQFAADSSGNLYTFNSPKGISLIQDGHLVPVNEEFHLLDMVESQKHDLWFSSTNGILRVRLNDLQNSARDSSAPLNYELIDRSDGLNSMQCSVGSPNMTITQHNQLWVATVKGLAMLDLDDLPGPSRKPEVFIGGVTVDTDELLPGAETMLPPGTHRVEFHLETVDLNAPQKIRLQYRLEGVDAGWLNAPSSRSVVYTNIPLGSHLFHVRSSSSDGIWDRNGIVYKVNQLPYFYETTWFILVCLAGLALLTWEASQRRVRRAQARVQLQMEERISERTRIARELHDTLLQSLHGLMFQFQAARNMLPRTPDKAQQTLDEAILGTEQAIAESRDAIHGLRSESFTEGDLAQLLDTAGEELAVPYASDQKSPTFRVIVEGKPRKLSPILQEELYRIAREVLQNAFRHARASHIEAQIRYDKNQLCLQLRDDGRGIERNVLEHSKRPGHWGLPGVSERAVRIGARLRIWSEAGAGTEVELTVPGAIAYKDTHDRSRFKLFRKDIKS